MLQGFWDLVKGIPFLLALSRITRSRRSQLPRPEDTQAASGEVHVVRNYGLPPPTVEAFCQKPCALAVMESEPPASVKLSDDRSPGQQPWLEPHEKPWGKAPTKAILNFWPRKLHWIRNTCCFKLLNVCSSLLYTIDYLHRSAAQFRSNSCSKR